MKEETATSEQRSMTGGEDAQSSVTGGNQYKDESNQQMNNRENDQTSDATDYEEDSPAEDTEINCLRQANLLTVPIKVSEITVSALVDSGAALSCIREDIARELHLAVEGEATALTGYGDSKLRTEGSVTVDMRIGNYCLEWKLHVLRKDAIKQKMVIGLDLLKHFKAEIDLGSKTISLCGQDKSKVSLQLEGEDINLIEYNLVPVYAANDLEILNNEIGFVKVEAKRLVLEGNYLFEGTEEKEQFIGGIISEEKRSVAVQNRTGKKVKVKKGQQVGVISTLLEDKERAEEESWTMAKLREKVDLSASNLSKEEENDVYRMLIDINGVLSRSDDDIGCAQVTPHKIRLSNDTPIWQKPRTFAQPVNSEIEQQCSELLAADIIELSDSHWSSPCVPVRKPDGSLRLCVDYRMVNNRTITEKFPMPNLNHCLYKASNMKWYTKLDLVRGYYQIPIDDSSKQLTAFSTPQNHYQFKRLPFGLKNAGIAFQKTMQTILAPYRSSNLVVYIDDILVMTETFREHILLVKKVLNTLANNGIKVKVPKCEFFRPEVTFLGHVMNRDGIRKSEEYVRKIEEYPKPETTTELRKFLGLINFHRRFIKDCSGIAKPLAEVTGGPKKKKIEWTEQKEKAFDRLKEEVMKRSLFNLPRLLQRCREAGAVRRRFRNSGRFSTPSTTRRSIQDDRLRVDVLFSNATKLFNDRKRINSYQMGRRAL